MEASHLYNLFGGYSPEGDRPLVQLQSHDEKATHRPGWDLTFSAPKSVSALWSQLGPEDRQALQAAHFEAVTRALDYLQETAALTRRGRGGNDFESTGLVIATFEQDPPERERRQGDLHHRHGGADRPDFRRGYSPIRC